MTLTPTNAQALALLQEWQKRHDDLDAAMDQLSAAVGDMTGSRLYEAAWLAFDSYTRMLAQVLGDREEWIVWFHGENDMGELALQAGYGEDLQPIVTLEDLLRLIEQGRGRP